MGAAYIESSRIIIASNDKKTHPLSKEYDSRWNWLHAEHNLLRNIVDASEGVVYIYREKKCGSLANARPCSGCMRLLKDRGVRKIVYTIENTWVTERL
jgi:tRNA(Arg) A34 adenosine deaminase TadA